MPLYIPENYTNILGTVQNTEKAVKSVKDMFQDNLSAQLALLRVTAPMVILSAAEAPLRMTSVPTLTTTSFLNTSWLGGGGQPLPPYSRRKENL